jgi:hypothetical protein
MPIFIVRVPSIWDGCAQVPPEPSDPEAKALDGFGTMGIQATVAENQRPVLRLHVAVTDHGCWRTSA